MRLSIRIPKGKEEEFNRLPIETHEKIRSELSEALEKLMTKYPR